MARANCLLAVNEALLEGCLSGKGSAEPSNAASILLDAPAEGASPSLGAALSGAGWRNLPAVLVLPTSAVSVRRLHFPFADAKKIRQVLPAVLEEELIDDPAQFAVDIEIFPDGEGEADVMAYLVPRETLAPVQAELEAQHLTPLRTTFAARALLESHPSEAAQRFMVYAGMDEWFVAQVQGGRLHSVLSVPVGLPNLLRAVHGAGLTRPELLQQALSSRNGHGAATAISAPVSPVASAEPGQAAAASRLSAEVTPLVGEVNRTLVIQGQGQAYELSLHGFFAPTLQVSDDGLHVEARTQPPAWNGRQLFGVLGDLTAAPQRLALVQGLNFTRGGSGLLAQMGRMKAPLAVTALLVVLLTGLALFGFFTRVQQLQTLQVALRHDLQRELKLPAPPSAAQASVALRRLTAERDRLRGERSAAARFEDYDYEALRLLTGISDVMGELSGLTVESLTYNPNRFSISGTTPDYANSEKLRTELSSLPAFEGREAKITHSRSAQAITYRITVER